MIDALVAMYRKGALTADHLTAQCLHMVDPDHPGLILNALPHEVLTRMLEFTRQYTPNGMVTNYGPLPATDQVAAAKRWLEEEFQQSRLGATSGSGTREQRDSA